MSSSKEIERSEVGRLLKAGGYLHAYEELVKQAEREVSKAEKSTVAQRKTLSRLAIEKHDSERLADLEEKAAALIATINSNLIDLKKPRLLTKRKAKALTEELLAQRDLKELLEVRKEMIREAVFNSLNLQLGAEGVEDPENTNGSIPVPELGKRLSREACGPKDPKLNEEKLEIDLGEERWLQVCEVEEIPEQVIPAHTQYTLSVERLMKLAESDLSILEIVRDCLEVGGYKTPRFFVRNL